MFVGMNSKDATFSNAIHLLNIFSDNRDAI